ncbi:auxin-responsive protein SAUR68-like [Phragmites australis]|uniref:auxin-responsive protein SAUR68-like n=1 Tax=Phragmites australis TaxID=29695 RepID=UPI002D78326B|nr:auxin-responsive protein SAUR68-like [Phragmites australis]
MVRSLKLTEISKKWHGGSGTKISSPTAAACPRGHFAAYTRDGHRFFIPIAYLGSDTFRELLNMAEEEFGAPGGRPIVLPCSADRLEQILDAFRGSKKTCAGVGRISKIW